jgi:hypothetical protein
MRELIMLWGGLGTKSKWFALLNENKRNKEE